MINIPRISIVTVVYNAADCLEKTVLSVVNQTYRNIEYIIIDGGSTDGTVDIIKKYEKHLAYWVSEPDKGIYDAMNKSMEKATGDWLHFINAGDWFYDLNTVDKMVSKMDCINSLYYGNVFMRNIKKKYWGKFSSIKLAIKNICHQSIFYPKCIYKKYSYSLEFKVFADYHYNISIYPLLRFEYIDIIVCNYDNQGFSSFTKDEKFNKTVNKLLYDKIGLFPLICRIIHRKLGYIKRFFYNL
ncbi:MAG: glycosyltransferase [Prevotellaceae bacterium]|jgi:glycosyltransferase involved in cell wall biosynthesis|nr:glycosyltransferase [Prevotellaceae bacterium]